MFCIGPSDTAGKGSAAHSILYLIAGEERAGAGRVNRCSHVQRGCLAHAGWTPVHRPAGSRTCSAVGVERSPAEQAALARPAIESAYAERCIDQVHGRIRRYPRA